MALRDFYGALLALSQDPSALGSRYWGLEYFNNPGMFPDCPAGFYSFARFETGAGRLMVVVANFTPFQGASGPIRLPQDLLDAAGLAGAVEVRQVLDESGTIDVLVTSTTADTLPSVGFSVDLPDQRAAVYIIE